MSALDTQEPLSDDELVRRYANNLQEEYIKAESVVRRKLSGSRSAVGGESRARAPHRMVAVWDGESVVRSEDFVEVRCRQSNSVEISFWVKQPPATRYYVVEFQSGDEKAYLKGRVKQANPDLTAGNGMYLVIAEFSGRIDDRLLQLDDDGE